MTFAVPSRPEVTVLRQAISHRAQISGGAPVPATTIDWRDLIETAGAHGVTALLTSPLVAQPEHVPAWVVEDLTQHMLAATGQNLNRTAQIVSILDRFSREGIRALTFKGPVFAFLMHESLGRRVSNDVDILIDRANAARARAVLRAAGYRLASRRRHRAGSLLYGLYPTAGRTDVLSSGVTGETDVDLQVGLAEWTHGFPIDTADLFARAITVDVAGRTLPTLCPNDVMLSMAIHGLQHGWSFLRSVADVDAAAAHVTDWDAVIARAQAARMGRALRVAVLVTSGMLDSSIPERVVSLATTDARAVEIAHGIAARIVASPWHATAEWGARDFAPAFQEGAARLVAFHTRRLTYEWFLKWPWDEWLGRRR